ncbi:MAG: hypothetical protein SF028_01770 [Candidatus Sumerlaeia bacterium]|nr:hypothetical protein [Candidatus Sumerlaeia bacterium]
MGTTRSSEAGLTLLELLRPCALQRSGGSASAALNTVRSLGLAGATILAALPALAALLAASPMASLRLASIGESLRLIAWEVFAYYPWWPIGLLTPLPILLHGYRVPGRGWMDELLATSAAPSGIVRLALGPAVRVSLVVTLTLVGAAAWLNLPGPLPGLVPAPGSAPPSAGLIWAADALTALLSCLFCLLGSIFIWLLAPRSRAAFLLLYPLLLLTGGALLFEGVPRAVELLASGIGDTSNPVAARIAAIAAQALILAGAERFLGALPVRLDSDAPEWPRLHPSRRRLAPSGVAGAARTVCHALALSAAFAFGLLAVIALGAAADPVRLSGGLVALLGAVALLGGTRELPERRSSPHALPLIAGVAAFAGIVIQLWSEESRVAYAFYGVRISACYVACALWPVVAVVFAGVERRRIESLPRTGSLGTRRFAALAPLALALGAATALPAGAVDGWSSWHTVHLVLSISMGIGLIASIIAARRALAAPSDRMPTEAMCPLSEPVGVPQSA